MYQVPSILHCIPTFHPQCLPPNTFQKFSLTSSSSEKSNRHCFNDGYHTSHHLNPRRHWRDHPLAFIKGKSEYTKGRALTFHNIDYIMLTITLLRKDYMHLASCLIPMGEQIGMTQVEIAEMLRRKTRRFSEEEIMKKYGKVS